MSALQCKGQGYGEPKAEFCCESTGEGTRCCATETAVFTLVAAVVGPSTNAAVMTSRSVVSSLGSLSSVGTASVTETGRSEIGLATTTPAVPKISKDDKTVGIGVGVGVGVALMILLATIVVVVRRHKKRKAQVEHVSSTTCGEGVNYIKTELEAKHLCELATHPAELPPCPTPVLELPGHVHR